MTKLAKPGPVDMILFKYSVEEMLDAFAELDEKGYWHVPKFAQEIADVLQLSFVSVVIVQNQVYRHIALRVTNRLIAPPTTS